jgi:peptidoglycan/LPS O-acetylase OafA/YrhL
MVTTTGIKNGTEIELTYYTGLCVPSDCRESDLSTLDSLFVGAAEFNNATNINISYFSVTDYVKKNQGMPGAGEIIIILVILIFGGGIAIGTLIHLTKFCDKSHIKARSTREEEEEENGEYSAIANEGEIDPRRIKEEFDSDTATLYRKKPLASPTIAFSILRNAPKLVAPQKNSQLHPQSISENESTLQIMGGMRFYAMLWIIYANTLALTEKGVVSNIENKANFFKSFMFTIFPTAFFAADVFFFMSGFLAIYSMLKMTNYTVANVFKQYFRRVYRLVPIIAFVMFTARYLIPRFVEGPMCQRYNEQFADCDQHFWKNLVLIRNFYPSDISATCLPWVWFVSCNFQLFLLVPVIGVIFQRSKMGGYVISLSLVGLSLILTGVLNGIADNPGANPYLDVEFFNDLYIKPWARAVPYYLGVFLGSVFYFYSKNQGENKIILRIQTQPIIRALMYATGFAFMFTIVFVQFDYTKTMGTNWSIAGKVIYSTISSLVFILGVIGWILPALLNRAKLFRFLLIGPILTICGRVSYMNMLIHPILMIGIYTTSGQQIYVEGYKMFAIFVGHAFLSYLVSISLHLLIEMPQRALEGIWYDRYFAHNMVENWLTAQHFGKEDNKKYGHKLEPVESDEPEKPIKNDAKKEETKAN